MDDVSQYYLVAGTFGAVIAVVVTVFAVRTARRVVPSRPGFDPDSPDPELLDEIPGHDDASVEGPSFASENLRSPSPPRVGVGALREADTTLSEPELSAEVQGLFSAAWVARGAGDLGALAGRFSEGAAETLLSGRGALGAVREVIADAPVLLHAAVEEPWSHATWQLQAIVHGVWGGETRDFLVQERWNLTRPAGGGAPWKVQQILDREQSPLSRPALERGRHIEAGTSLATLFAPDLEAQKQALLARRPDLDVDEFLAFVPDLFVRVQSALDMGDPGALGALVTPDRRQALEFAVARLDRAGLRARSQDPVVQDVELCRVDQDARDELLTVRVHARCRQWVEDYSGGLVDGVSTEARDYSEYWTFVRPVGGEPAAARGRQGFALWRIEADEAYNG